MRRDEAARGFGAAGDCVMGDWGRRGRFGEKETWVRSASESLGRGDMGVFGRDELDVLLGERSPAAEIGARPVRSTWSSSALSSTTSGSKSTVADACGRKGL